MKLLYLTFSSRLQDNPASLVAEGPSSSGKSHILDEVLKIFPTSAYWFCTSMSERALIYSEEDLRHRHVVIAEASGNNSDFLDYIIHSLLSEGRIEYPTVDRNSAGKLESRMLVKEGPTGLIMTTTKPKLHPENETRYFRVPVTDSRAQTKAIFKSLANENRAEMDLERWKAYQTWLEGSETRVTLPWGSSLAEIVPPEAVRMRRDLGRFFTLVRTHAVMHQRRRDKDGEGRIVATLEDYEAVRSLMSDLLAEGVGKSVNPSVRRAVDAVRRLVEDEGLDHVPRYRVAEERNIDKGPASRNVSKAVSEG